MSWGKKIDKEGFYLDTKGRPTKDKYTTKIQNQNSLLVQVGFHETPGLLTYIGPNWFPNGFKLDLLQK